MPRGSSAARPEVTRQVRVEHVMGTTVSVDVREPAVPDAVLDELIAWFHDVDRRFSPYRRASEVSRVGDGRLRFEDASPDVRAMFTLADELRDRTEGFFDPRGFRRDGRPDPTGVVKGWAVDEAVARLRLAGAASGQVVAGGDLVAIGEPQPGRPWRIGIRHPDDASAVAAILGVRDMAVATSGLYERGAHIIDPHTGTVPAGLRSMTVVGPSLTLADAYATAAFAMGEAGLGWVAGQPGFGALGITAGDRVVWTPLVGELLVTG
ncbi:MAG TPA: FAD:protein FMN transferase [Candidatus Limnocylindrales bacterium]|nr:FAD:protein FMN transferase [Candidatus Limnocylindrales bacterium]